MSATHMGTMVSKFRETGGGNLEVLQRSQMKNDTLTRQSSSPTKSSLVGVLFFTLISIKILCPRPPCRFAHSIYIVSCPRTVHFNVSSPVKVLGNSISLLVSAFIH